MFQPHGFIKVLPQAASSHGEARRKRSQARSSDSNITNIPNSTRPARKPGCKFAHTAIVNGSHHNDVLQLVCCPHKKNQREGEQDYSEHFRAGIYPGGYRGYRY